MKDVNNSDLRDTGIVSFIQQKRENIKFNIKVYTFFFGWVWIIRNRQINKLKYYR